MNEKNKLNPLLEAMNDIDDAIISESAPAEKKRAKYFKPMIIAAAAAVLCAATAVTATASLKPPQQIIISDEPLSDVDYTVYTDEKGREIRTYAITLPDYALVEEKEGYTAVGAVKLVAKEGCDIFDEYVLVDEAGNVFNTGINNKEVRCDIIDPAHPETHYDYGVDCVNFNYKEYSWSMFYEYDDDNSAEVVPDRVFMYIYRYDDKETVRKLYERYGRRFNEEDEKEFDRSVERHREIYFND